jgi:hypothetical protein
VSVEDGIQLGDVVSRWVSAVETVIDGLVLGDTSSYRLVSYFIIVADKNVYHFDVVVRSYNFSAEERTYQFESKNKQYNFVIDEA